ncbi:MAG: hypothetical protein A2521_08965 [Deltaproteobacteria bacterium RIFOXYD12_FULL_57_12]|nr:MAG: hypothetical protein A2521_08965 [Deltaproteobacteria bacterium RIFOXYD12_FULL_57_12]
MKIVVTGPGAMGCLLAATLTLKGQGTTTALPEQPVWLQDHSQARARQLNDNGLILEENGGRLHCPVRAFVDPSEIGQADLVLLCVKSGNFQNGLTQALALTAADSLIVTLQNGIAHLERINQQPVDNTPIAVGVTAQGATLVATGHVRHAGHGLTRLGFPSRQSAEAIARLQTVAALLSGAGIETEVVDNILDHVWAKLLVNVGINALTAIHACPNGRLLEIPEVRVMLGAAVREAAAVARALGIALPDEPVARTEEVCRATARNISSMLQDVIKKRCTEIDAINGAVATAGKRLGMALPVNEALVARIKEIEQGYLL